MKPFHLVAVPHKDILEGRLTMDVFAADLWEVFKQRSVEDYQNPEIFFRKTFLTFGLKNLLNIATKRLRGEGGDPVVQIQTPFGGGKTHSLIALYHAFSNPEAVQQYFEDALKANVVVIVGTAISPQKKGDEITGTLWGEIEKQLEGEIRELKQPIAPGREAIRKLLEKHQPLLILMDEVLEYVAKAAGIKLGYQKIEVGESSLAAQTIAFMQELTETVKTLDRSLLVITLPSSVMEYPDEEMAESLLSKLQKVAGRIEKIYSPVSGDEIYEVIRRRLFSRVDEIAAKEIVDAFIDYYEKEGIVIEKAEYREKMLRSYPFHPEVIDVLHRRWGSLPTFQRTRGVLRILSLVVYKLKEENLPLIRPCDFELEFNELSEELIKHIGREFESVLAADITSKDSNSKKVDSTLAGSYKGLRLGSKLAKSIFLYSFSGGEKGVSLGELKLACADINVPSSVLTEVLENLTNSLYYLWKEDGRYVFKSQPNLNKAIISKMSEIDASLLNEETRKLLEKYSGKALPTYLYPQRSKDIPDSEEFKLVILPTNDQSFLQKILNEYGENPRVNRNTIFFLLPMESERYQFEAWLKKKMAWESIARDTSLNLTESQKKDVERNVRENVKDERNKLRHLYRLLYVPAKEMKEIDLGIPTYGDKRTLSEEVLEKLKSESEIIEKLSPYYILEQYLGSKDFLELKQLYKSLLTTPGEPRISKANFIKSIKNGIESGVFGFGIVKDGIAECKKIREKVEITLTDYEVIVRGELCEKEEPEVEVHVDTTVIEERKAEKGIEVGEVTTGPVKTEIKTHPEITAPEYKAVTLNVKVPKGKFSDFYKGVLLLLENNFEDTNVYIKIEAKKGSIRKADYEDKVKETITQINGEIVEEDLE
jgi:hypothetical protein